VLIMSDAKRLSRGFVGGLPVGALALLSGVTNVHAAQNVTIDEIIVTAQKRSEALIDVPLSVSVVDGQLLERQNATNFQDYLKLVPGPATESGHARQRSPGHARRQHGKRCGDRGCVCR
jgi:iron complex outermembrane recepter protein